MLLAEIMNIPDLRAQLAAGNITVRTHPEDETLRVLCYSRRVQFGGQWTEVVRQCRGLIVSGVEGDLENWVLVERPWKKFFSLHQIGTKWSQGDDEDGTGELELEGIDLAAPAVVTDKLDGSLLVLYPHPVTGAPAYATKGSFDSDQAVHFTGLVNRWPLHLIALKALLKLDDFTFLFEGVGPSNQIVLAYPQDEVVLLGAVDKRTGIYFGPATAGESWISRGLPVAEVLPAETVLEATELADRAGKEGVVARLVGLGELVKIKQGDYLAMHRAMFNYGLKAVLGILSAASLTWADVEQMARSGTVMAIPAIRQAIENVGIPKVVAERAAFLDSIVMSEVHQAVNAWNYVSALPAASFLYAKPEIKREFARRVSSHSEEAKANATHLFAALDYRIDPASSDKRTEVFLNSTSTALARAFKAKETRGDANAEA